MISFVSSEITRAVLRKQFNSSDFFFDLAGSEPIEGDGGTFRALFVDKLPSLAGEGVSHALFNLGPCGINAPHR